MLDSVDVRKRLKKVLKNGIYKQFTDIECSTITEELYRDSREMADLSLIRTLSCYEFYSHDFFGYSMIRHLLKTERTPFCDLLLSLDSYRHWFPANTTKFRADLLWLLAYVENRDGKIIFRLKLTIIESKVAENVFASHADKACYQVVETRNALKKHFNNIASFDSRYWWMQLHRIISSNSTIMKDENRLGVMQALEYLAEGDFEVDWDSYVIAFEQSENFASNPITKRICHIASENDEQVLFIEIPSDGVKKYMSSKMTLPFSSFVDSIGTVDDYECTRSEKDLKSAIKEDDNQRLGSLYGKDMQPEYDNENDLSEDEDIELGSTESTTIDDFTATVGTISADNSNSYLNVLSNINSENSAVDNQSLDDRDIPNSDNIDAFDAKSDICGMFDNDETYEVSKVDPDYDVIIPIGRTASGENAIWAYGNNPEGKLINRHMLILGSSGSGKSYAIKAILGELARNHQASLIVDYTEGFTEDKFVEFPEYVAPQYVVKKGIKLPINPFLKHESVLDNSYDVATRVSSVFHRIYSDMGDNQISVFNDIIEQGVDAYDTRYTMSQLLVDLESMANEVKGAERNTIRTLSQKIKPFCKVDPFKVTDGAESAWKKVFYELNRKDLITIFQLKNIASDVQHAITDFILWDLWYYMTAIGSSAKTPHAIVLDEIQNLDVSNDNTPVYKILKEGRKLGLGVIAATQDIAGLGGVNSPGTAALMNSGTFMFFAPPPNEMDSYAKLLNSLDSRRSKEDWKHMLGTLGLGECIYFSNDSYSKKTARKIKILTLEERGLK